jgi:hypothetical protein
MISDSIVMIMLVAVLQLQHLLHTQRNIVEHE